METHPMKTRTVKLCADCDTTAQANERRDFIAKLNQMTPEQLREIERTVNALQASEQGDPADYPKTLIEHLESKAATLMARWLKQNAPPHIQALHQAHDQFWLSLCLMEQGKNEEAQREWLRALVPEAIKNMARIDASFTLEPA